jgi:hypothetical protein
MGLSGKYDAEPLARTAAGRKKSQVEVQSVWAVLRLDFFSGALSLPRCPESKF